MIERGLCECGCGERAPIASKTNRALGHIKGQPLRFVTGHNLRLPRLPESPEQTAERFWAKVDRRGEDECWEWQASRFRHGYGQITIAGRNRQAHRVAFELSCGVPLHDPHLFVCHRCDNPQCCNPAHLFLGDAAVNNADMHSKGRARLPARGTGAGCKLTREQVAEIRERYAAGGVSQRALAASYGVQQMTISRAVRGESW